MENTQERSVIVLGRTGCGKSTFIRAMMLDGDLSKANIEAASRNGLELPDVSSRVSSCTKKPNVYQMQPFLGGESYKLIDCMGMQDTDREDTKSVQQMAKVLSCLTSLVGIVYIIDGRMTPSEAANCKFIFNELLADVKPADVLVVRTKHEEWDEYDADEEKLYLKGGIPSLLQKATWIAVNFNKYNHPDEGCRQVGLIRKNFTRWRQRLKLSDKTKIACDYLPDYIWLVQAKKELSEKQKELEDYKMKLRKMELTNRRQAKEAAENEAKIKELQETICKLKSELDIFNMVKKIVLGVASIFFGF